MSPCPLQVERPDLIEVSANFVPMDGSISLACKTFTVVHARWVARPGKLRKTVKGIGHVVWDQEGNTCQIYIPGRLEAELAPSVVDSLSKYVGEPLTYVAAETLALVMTRPETLESVPPGFVAIELSKWNTGVGWYEPNRILAPKEVETAWQRILDHLGEDKARWHTYSPALPGFG